MDHTSQVRRTATACALVAAVLLASIVTVTPASAAGGAFTGNYHGTFTSKCTGSACTYKFSGTGSGTFIGKSSISASYKCPYGCYGTATLTSTSNHANSVRISFSGASPNNGTYTVTGGKGKFAKAAGSGNVTGSLTGTSSGTFKATFTGTLTY